MKTKNKTYDIDELIMDAEKKNANDLLLLKEQFHLTKESLQPLQLMKNFFREVTTSPEIKTNVVNNAIGLGTGLLTKQLIVGGSHSPVKKVLGTLLEFAVANSVSKHVSDIKEMGANLILRLLKPLQGQTSKQIQ